MILLEFPELRQVYTYDCGACALCSILAYAGIDRREERVMQLAGTNPDTVDQAGTSYDGMLRVLGYFDIDNEPCGSIADLKYSIVQGWPVLLCLQAYQDEGQQKPFKDDWADGHYVVAIGIDGDRIIFEDPSSYRRTWLLESELAERWHDVDKGVKTYFWGRAIKCAPKYHHNDMEHMG